MKELPEKFREFRKLHGNLTQAELGEMLGVTGNYIYLIEKGIKRPSKGLTKLFESMYASLPQMGGQPGAITPNISLPNSGIRPSVNPLTFIPGRNSAPVVSWAAAGVAHDYADLANQIEEVIYTDSRDPNAFALIVEGDSMYPEITAGDTIIFSPNGEPRNGNIVVARLAENHGVLVKRFRRTGPEGKTIVLESTNKDYPPLTFPIEAFRFIYPAVEMRRKWR
jgi:SOS-response transcriptional repressor LexA